MGADLVTDELGRDIEQGDVHAWKAKHEQFNNFEHVPLPLERIESLLKCGASVTNHVGIDMNFVPIILVALLAGCMLPGGEACRYEQHSGVAEVISVDGSKYQLRFALLPESGIASHSEFPLSRLNGDVFDARTSQPEVEGATIGSRFHTEVSVITEGTCTPTSYKIVAPMEVEK